MKLSCKNNMYMQNYKNIAFNLISEIVLKLKVELMGLLMDDGCDEKLICHSISDVNNITNVKHSNYSYLVISGCGFV